MTTTYDSNKDTITGDKLFIFIGGLPIAFGTSCGIDLSADTIDTANKMSGAWKASLAGQLGYSISSDSLMSKKEGHLSFKKLKSIMAKREAVDFTVATVSKTDDGGFEQDVSWYEGTAFITALSLKADNGAVCTSSITLTGSGELKDGEPSS